jgi:hypothetical protein
MSKPSDRRVYAIPFTLTVKATFYTLAYDLDEARNLAVALRATPVNEEGLIIHYVTILPHAVYSQDPDIINFDDVSTSSIDVVGTHLVDAETYPPRNHPMWVGVPRR